MDTYRDLLLLNDLCKSAAGAVDDRRRLVTYLPDPDFWRGRSVSATGHTAVAGGWLAFWLGAWAPRSPAIA